MVYVSVEWLNSLIKLIFPFQYYNVVPVNIDIYQWVGPRGGHKDKNKENKQSPTSLRKESGEESGFDKRIGINWRKENLVSQWEDGVSLEPQQLQGWGGQDQWKVMDMSFDM